MPEIVEEAPRTEVPEDVATLYAWANLKGASYQDFSAARREYRAQVRARATENHRNHAARGEFTDPGRGTVLREAAGVDRTRLVLEAAAARLRESEPPKASADERPAMAGRGPTATTENMMPQRFPQRRSAREMMPQADRETEAAKPVGEGNVDGREHAARDWNPARGTMPHLLETAGAVAPGIAGEHDGGGAAKTSAAAGERAGERAGDQRASGQVAGGQVAGGQVVRGQVASGQGAEQIADRENTAPIPAWLHGAGLEAPGTAVVKAVPESSPVVSDTLQHTRERVASRWYALRGVFDPTAPEMEPTQAHTRAGGNAVLVVFSLAGGVGKTSLTASMGRALSASGERVLMVDVAAHGLLPFFFGANELRAGVVRRFLPPAGSTDAPISLLSHDLARRVEAESAGNESLAMELVRNSKEYERVLVDLSPAAPAMLRELVRTGATVLVPVAPDMNSVITLGAVEKFFADLTDGAGRPVQPRYLLTQFDPALPLHLDVREVIRQQLGERLLPFVIRRSPAVAEALAEGMTVMDYAPESGVAADYRDAASWARAVAAGPAPSRRPGRWSER